MDINDYSLKITVCDLRDDGENFLMLDGIIKNHFIFNFIEDNYESDMHDSDEITTVVYDKLKEDKAFMILFYRRFRPLFSIQEIKSVILWELIQLNTRKHQLVTGSKINLNEMVNNVFSEAHYNAVIADMIELKNIAIYESLYSKNMEPLLEYEKILDRIISLDFQI